jgi:integrase
MRLRSSAAFSIDHLISLGSLAGLGLSWSHINQVSCALRFFFGVTLGRQEAFDRIVSAKEPKNLPVVLSAEEITRFLRAVPGLRSRAALTAAYGTGLRSVRGRGTQGRRHQQQPDGDPDRTGQGRQGPLRHAFAAAMRIWPQPSHC